MSAVPTPLARDLDDGDGTLRRLFSDEALTVNGFREEPVPDQAAALSCVLGDERGVTSATPPPLVEHRELRKAEQNDLGRQTLLGFGTSSNVEHLPQECCLVGA